MNRDELDRLEELLNLLGAHRPAWQAKAACRDAGIDTFFPERGESHLAALRLCQSCPVRDECAEWGLNSRDGIFGGLTGRQRRREQRRRLIESGVPPYKTSDDQCRLGHVLDAETRYVDPTGLVRCRVCMRENSARYAAAKRARRAS